MKNELLEVAERLAGNPTVDAILGALEIVRDDAWDEGYDEGYDDGEADGYERGYDDGVDHA